jgi:hypothetical protein
MDDVESRMDQRWAWDNDYPVVVILCGEDIKQREVQASVGTPRRPPDVVVRMEELRMEELPKSSRKPYRQRRGWKSRPDRWCEDVPWLRNKKRRVL